MLYRPSREESEDVIRKLAETYPKFFLKFHNSGFPLKKDIIQDIINNGFPVANELFISSGIKAILGYQYQLKAEASLNGLISMARQWLL
jgi:hypothetical protein